MWREFPENLFLPPQWVSSDPDLFNDPITSQAMPPPPHSPPLSRPHTSASLANTMIFIPPSIRNTPAWLNFETLFLFILWLCMFTHGHTYVEVRRQLSEVGSPLLPCKTQGLNSGPEAWQQAPLPTKPSCQPRTRHLLR